MERYRLHEGIIVGRRVLPGGDVMLRFVTLEGSLEAVARKALRPTGRSGRLMLFHHVRFQAYHKPGSDLPTLTQAELVGRLEGLTAPSRFAAASYLGELAYHLAAPEVAARLWPLLTSALRGVGAHPRPIVPLVWGGWRMLRAAGLGPALASRCGHAPTHLEPGGTLACGACAGAEAVFLGGEGAQALARVLTQPGTAAIPALEAGPVDRLLRALRMHVEQHVGPLRSEGLLSVLAAR
ncbi:DNA repair protein RecO [Marinithermus hydrothermalis]|uniref:DNA repair protein RecO n=1 Tax=Marinithermus hydrothermalis (strain DSM 14884 / JCM 11576 / T1) TaxID=869210 RepID=F2NLC9_MARHT|nr:DNA repair protein RecO C-terminal domain-containing protein [Marinithermus hydrothermalis]AEB11748.1 Recombination protein O RecO [Marinithermus hydrothermalis DSM 14884]